MNNSSIKQKAISGAKWTTLERLSSQGLQFVIGILVSRLVSPTDYGIVGMLTIFIAFGNAIVDSGFGVAIIRQEERSNEDYSTVFVFNIIVGLLLYLLLFFLSPLISSFYNVSILEEIVKVYGLLLLVNSLVVVQVAKLTSELRFKIQFIVTSVSLIVSGVVGVLLAYNGFGVWAIVWQQLSFRIAYAVLIWLNAHWRPMLLFSRDSFKKLFSFGSNMLLMSFITIIYDNIYNLIIGKFYSADYVGHYTRSQQIVNVPQSGVSQIVSKVCVPILSPYQNDNKKLLMAYEKIFRLAIFFCYPVLVGLVVLAEPLIYILLGEKWLPCVPYLRILSLGAMCAILTLINLNLFVVKGRSDLLLKLSIIKKIIGFTIVGLTISHGMYWICFGTSFYAICAFIINSHQTNKILGYGALKQLLTISPVIIKALIMGALVFLLTSLFENAISKLLIGILAGFITYFGIGFLVKDKSHLDCLEIIKKKI